MFGGWFDGIGGMVGVGCLKAVAPWNGVGGVAELLVPSAGLRWCCKLR